MPAPKPTDTAILDTSNSDRESASAAVIANAEPKLAPLGMPEHMLLVAAWLGCAFLVWLPVMLVVTGCSLLLVWIGASYALLQSGAFLAAEGSFLRGALVGILLALTAGIGTVLRLLSRPQAQRERVIGPGGRVLRIILGRPAPPESRLAEWFPDASMLLISAALLVACQAWVWRRPSAGTLTISLVLASLMFLMSSWLISGLWEWVSFGWSTYRFARRTQYRAGLLSGLFLVIGLVAGGLWWKVADRARAGLATQDMGDAMDESFVHKAPSTVLRTGLFETAEEFWPERATQEGVRHLIAQLVERTAHENPDEISWLSIDALPRLAQNEGIVSDDGNAASTFAGCIKELFPDEVTRVKKLPSFKSFRLDDDTEHDVLLGAVLKICEIHVFRRPYRDKKQVLARAAVNGAIDSKRRGKRIVSADTEGEYLAVCPNPYAEIDARIAAEQELARINWGALKPLQKSVILEKAVMELDDDEIAANHHMDQGKVKDTYQNAIKKVRNKLVAACP